MAISHECCECKKGEHESYTDGVAMYTVRDPGSKRLRLRGYLCEEHVRAFLDDGFELVDDEGAVLRP